MRSRRGNDRVPCATRWRWGEQWPQSGGTSRSLLLAMRGRCARDVLSIHEGGVPCSRVSRVVREMERGEAVVSAGSVSAGIAASSRLSNGEHGRTSSRMSVASASTGERPPSQQYTNTCTHQRPRPRARAPLLAVLRVADNVNGDIQSLVLAHGKLPSHSSEPPKPPSMLLLIARMVPRKRRQPTISKYSDGLYAWVWIDQLPSSKLPGPLA